MESVDDIPSHSPQYEELVDVVTCAVAKLNINCTRFYFFFTLSCHLYVFIKSKVNITMWSKFKC